MALYKIGETDFERLNDTTFESEKISERYDLQRILKNCIDVIAPDTMVIAEEFGKWTNSNRRIDLLAIDSDANLIVIELKRTQDGGHMELQSIRYASMISSMTFKQAVEVYAEHLGNSELIQAEAEILNFLGWDTASEEDFGNDVHIVLASAEFSMELTTSVLWLNDKGMDIKCIRMKPYRSNNEILVNVEQVIPLPEAEEFQVKVREKRIKQRHGNRSNGDFTKRDLTINGVIYRNLPKRRIIFEVVSAAIGVGAEIEDIRASMPSGKWMAIQGTVQNSDSFIEKANELKAQKGSRFNSKKFYTKDEELFQANGSTYALTNQWGRGTQSHVEFLQEKYSLEIEVKW